MRSRWGWDDHSPRTIPTQEEWDYGIKKEKLSKKLKDEHYVYSISSEEVIIRVEGGCYVSFLVGGEEEFLKRYWEVVDLPEFKKKLHKALSLIVTDNDIKIKTLKPELLAPEWREVTNEEKKELRDLAGDPYRFQDYETLMIPKKGSFEENIYHIMIRPEEKKRGLCNCYGWIKWKIEEQGFDPFSLESRITRLEEGINVVNMTKYYLYWRKDSPQEVIIPPSCWAIPPEELISDKNTVFFVDPLDNYEWIKRSTLTMRVDYNWRTGEINKIRRA